MNEWITTITKAKGKLARIPRKNTAFFLAHTALPGNDLPVIPIPKRPDPGDHCYNITSHDYPLLFVPYIVSVHVQDTFNQRLKTSSTQKPTWQNSGSQTLDYGVHHPTELLETVLTLFRRIVLFTILKRLRHNRRPTTDTLKTVHRWSCTLVVHPTNFCELSPKWHSAGKIRAKESSSSHLPIHSFLSFMILQYGDYIFQYYK